MSQRDDFVNIALAQVGILQYCFDDRCGWSQGCADCSGLVSGAANRVGLNVGCLASWQFANMCHAAVRPQWMIDQFGPGQGTGLTAEQAARTKGALKFHGPGEGRFGFGNLGHIAISLGDGRSVEALSHALDLRIWQFIEYKNTYYALLPGMTGFNTSPGENPGPKTAWEAKAMGMIAIAVPGAHVQNAGPRKGTMPLIAATSTDGIHWNIVGYNGTILPDAVNSAGKPIKPKNGLGVSVLELGKLNKPIESASVLFVPDPEDNHSPKRLIPSRQVIFAAGDGGTFGPYKVDVHYA